MSIDHIVLIIIGVISVIGGLYLLSEAKAYKNRHNHSNQQNPKFNH